MTAHYFLVELSQYGSTLCEETRSECFILDAYFNKVDTQLSLSHDMCDGTWL